MKKLFMLCLTAMLFSVAGYALTPITGTLGACVGDSVVLYGDSSVRTPTWSTSNASVASIDMYYGYVYAGSAGTATITFTDGSSYVTATFTVTAAPAAITGAPTSSVCPGTTFTLSDATSGGVWGTYTASVATVNPSTGVVTTLAAGTGYVTYTVGIGCSASVGFSVGSTTLHDSITGPYSVCVGSSITYSVVTTGGTWSTSNAAVASVASATGVVYGIATGTANISYTVAGSCGSSSVYRPVLVTTGSSAGTISGSTTLTAGGSSYLSSTVGGGSWSTSSAAVASINSSTGLVYAVSAGTAVITYTVTACGTTSTATTTVTVSAFTGISGWVHFGSGAYYGNVKVWLITYRSATSMLQAIDSTTVYAAGDSVYYSFASAATDTYRIKAATLDTFARTYGYIPTYHTSSYYWYSATVLNHTSGTGDTHQDINMSYGTATSGPGFIGGDVTTGANKGTAGSIPAIGLSVYLVNQTTGAVVAYTKTNASGLYSFSNLPVGASYKVFPEALNYATTPYPTISLTASAPSVTAASFIQHTISYTITPVPAGVTNVNAVSADISVYPNPTATTLNVEWTSTVADKGTITIADLSGRQVYQSNVNFTIGAGFQKIDVSSLSSGLYVVNIKSSGINFNQKVQVAH